jgi:hypothetical protein
MNGYVERCHRTMREEFYQARDYLPLTVHEIRKYLELDDYYYNYIRPHASLKNKPPMLYFKERFQKGTSLFDTKMPETDTQSSVSYVLNSYIILFSSCFCGIIYPTFKVGCYERQ